MLSPPFPYHAVWCVSGSVCSSPGNHTKYCKQRRHSSKTAQAPQLKFQDPVLFVSTGVFDPNAAKECTEDHDQLQPPAALSQEQQQHQQQHEQHTDASMQVQPMQALDSSQPQQAAQLTQRLVQGHPADSDTSQQSDAWQAKVQPHATAAAAAASAFVSSLFLDDSQASDPETAETAAAVVVVSSQSIATSSAACDDVGHSCGPATDQQQLRSPSHDADGLATDMQYLTHPDGHEHEEDSNTEHAGLGYRPGIVHPQLTKSPMRHTESANNSNLQDAQTSAGAQSAQHSSLHGSDFAASAFEVEMNVDCDPVPVYDRAAFSIGLGTSSVQEAHVTSDTPWWMQEPAAEAEAEAATFSSPAHTAAGQQATPAPGTFGRTAQQVKAAERKKQKLLRRAARQVQGSNRAGVAPAPSSDEVAGSSMDVVLQPAETFVVAAGSMFGGFQEHTTGIGSKLMQQMGWSAGSGLGRRQQGQAAPISAIRRPKQLGLGAN